ncbi:ATP-binding cassette domain-containing protein [Lentisalinibacter sediminis]|uniref:ATP-binding cassette domain-containing protein n=1 Tax=Lentisalinibacter sediminis TaxID=2992237 RepID=UPI003864DF1C
MDDTVYPRPDTGRRSPGTGEAHPLLPLVARGLQFTIDGRAIIRGVSFRIDTPGRTVILGPNGAGKSVLLRLCHGLIRPTGGELRWGELAVGQARGHQAMVLQQPVILRRSVSGNLLHVLAVKGVPRRERHAIVTAALERAGLAGLESRPARTLSGGQQKRLAIAGACMLRPAVLLLDEPTANLDPAAVRGVEELIRAAGAAGTKILMCTHDIAQAGRLAHDVLFVHDGRLLEHAGAERFFTAPEHPAAAGFLEGELLA